MMTENITKVVFCNTTNKCTQMELYEALMSGCMEDTEQRRPIPPIQTPIIPQASNTKPRKNVYSHRNGVHCDKLGKWVAIFFHHRRIYLGYFNTWEEAARIVDMARLFFRKATAKNLNFPESTYSREDIMMFFEKYRHKFEDVLPIIYTNNSK